MTKYCRIRNQVRVARLARKENRAPISIAKSPRGPERRANVELQHLKRARAGMERPEAGFVAIGQQIKTSIAVKLIGFRECRVSGNRWAIWFG
jgi:hypothetical protein